MIRNFLELKLTNQNWQKILTFVELPVASKMSNKYFRSKMTLTILEMPLATKNEQKIFPVRNVSEIFRLAPRN